VGPDGRLYVGLTENGQPRGWVWRTAEAVTVASEPAPEPEPEGLGLEVRPNPFRGAATVTLTLVRPSEVEAAVYDALGRRVAVLASGRFGAGRHALALGGTGLPAGVYVAYVTADSGGGAPAVAVRRLTITR